ncbi:Vacuolar protein sorting-associated protein 17, partial [Coemansia sp. RSA 2681]
PTYLGVVRSYGFNDMVDHPLPGPVSDTEHSALCFQPAAPESGSASSHDLGDCAALLCAISYGRKHSRRDSLLLQRSQVEYVISALEWVATWIPLFEDRARADLSAVVVREFVYLFYHTPAELQETLRQSSVPDSAAWNSGQFWRSTYIAAYDLLSRDALRLSSEHMRTLVHLSARGWNLQDDMVGTVFRHMTAHLLVYCAVTSCVPDLSLGRIWSWRDVLPDQFLLGDTKSCALHAYSACARMLQDLPEFPDSLREEDLGDREWLQTAIKLCLKTLFSIGDGDAEHDGETVAGDYLDAYDIASDIPRRDNYAGLVDKSTELAKLAMRLLERLAGRGDGVGGDSEPSTDILNDQAIAAEEGICASAMSQPIAVQQATICPSENELCGTPRGKKRKLSKSRRSSKRRKSAAGDSSREGTRETTPDTPPRLPPPLPPASAPEQLRRLIQEIETVVDASGSSLQPADIYEIDPHRLPPQQQELVTDGVRNSLYSDHMNPFSNNEAEQAAPWGSASQEEEASPTHSDVDEDDENDSVPSLRHERNYASQSAGDSGTQSGGSAKAPRPLLSFTVGQVVDRSKRSPNYTFDMVTNMPSYKARKYTGVERNQIEFERLEAHLRATYPECLVPTLGPGTTVSKYVPDYHNDRLVVLLLQQWLRRVSEHPILQQDYELRQFVEAPFAFNPALTASAASSTSALSMSPHGSTSGGGFFSW